MGFALNGMGGHFILITQFMGDLWRMDCNEERKEVQIMTKRLLF